MEQPSLFKGTIVCRRPDCDNPVRATGLCLNHYQAARRSKMPPCSVADCERPQQSKGYCQTHYSRSLYGQDIHAPVKKWSADRTCSADECSEQPDGHSMFCAEHKPPRFPSLVRDERGRKLCRTCEEWKPENDFGPGYATADRLASNCRDCNTEYRRQRRHGIGAKGRERLLKEQGGVCAICESDDPGTPHGWHIDHDHSCCERESCGKCVRGVLCNGCNTGLGQFADDTDRLLAAAQYLRNHRKMRVVA